MRITPHSRTTHNLVLVCRPAMLTAAWRCPAGHRPHVLFAAGSIDPSDGVLTQEILLECETTDNTEPSEESSIVDWWPYVLRGVNVSSITWPVPFISEGFLGSSRPHVAFIVPHVLNEFLFKCSCPNLIIIIIIS